MDGTRTDDHQQPVVLAIQAGANLITRVGDEITGIGAQRQIAQHLGGSGQHFEFQHTAVHDAADADLILPTRHIGLHQRILALVHGLFDRAKILRRVQLLLHGLALLGPYSIPRIAMAVQNLRIPGFPAFEISLPPKNRIRRRDGDARRPRRQACATIARCDPTARRRP